MTSTSEWFKQLRKGDIGGKATVRTACETTSSMFAAWARARRLTT